MHQQGDQFVRCVKLERFIWKEHTIFTFIKLIKPEMFFSGFIYGRFVPGGYRIGIVAECEKH